MVPKIYTKSGDEGQTALVSGNRVDKCHLRLEAYGTVDELNSVLGVVVARLQILKSQQNFESYAKEMMDWIQKLQHELFNVGSRLACDDDKILKNLPAITDLMISDMEKKIDQCQEALPELKNFILPGGSLVASYLHQGRTICRRAERATLRASKEESIDDKSGQYLNRLGDFLFVLARYSNFKEGKPDIVWQK